jgi:O-antigen/teichoic acid export membrane protein
LSLIKKTLLFGIPLIPAALVPFIRNAVDRIFITDYIGLSENGIYSLMVTISSLGFFVINVLFDTIIPDIYKMMSSKSYSFRDKEYIVITTSKFVGVFIVLNILGLIVFNMTYEFFIKEVYFDGVKYMPFLLLHIVFQSIFILLNKFIYFSKKTVKLGLIYLLISSLHILILLLLIRPFGVFGVIYSTLITDVVFLIVSYKLSQKYCNLPWNFIVKKLSIK